MPKEQIRKRGRRKPKTEVGAEAVTAGGAPIDEPQLELAPSAPTDAPGPSGIHPSRAALLKGGPRPRYEAPVPTTDQPHTQDEQETARRNGSVVRGSIPSSRSGCWIRM